MKKNILLLLLYTALGFLGLGWIIYNIDKEAENLKNAPQINYEAPVNIDVHSISFERNFLFLNDTLYDTEGISGYSRVHLLNKVIVLRDIKPPFLIRKAANNDTLHLIKEDSNYFLIITEEIRNAREE